MDFYFLRVLSFVDRPVFADPTKAGFSAVTLGCAVSSYYSQLGCLNIRDFQESCPGLECSLPTITTNDIKNCSKYSISLTGARCMI